MESRYNKDPIFRKIWLILRSACKFGRKGPTNHYAKQVILIWDVRDRTRSFRWMECGWHPGLCECAWLCGPSRFREAESNGNFWFQTEIAVTAGSYPFGFEWDGGTNITPQRGKSEPRLRRPEVMMASEGATWTTRTAKTTPKFYQLPVAILSHQEW
jgi:hypothetical protein